MRRKRLPGREFRSIAVAAIVSAAALISLVPGPAGAAPRRAMVVPDHLTFSIATPVIAGSNFTVKVTARDAAENKLTSYNGSATWSDLSGTISPATPSSFVNGVSTTSANVPAPFHDDRITITTSGVVKQSVQFNVFGPLDHIGVAKPLGATPGNNFSVTARAYDAANTILTSYNGSATWSDLSGTMTGAPTSFVNGVSSGSAQIPTPQHEDILHVVSGGKAGDSAKFNVVGPLDHLVVHGLVNADAGTSLTVKVTAYDAANNYLSHYNGSATWSELSGGLSPATPNSFVNGLSSTSATFSTPFRGDRLQVVTGGVTGKSQLFNVLGPLDHFVVTAPAGPVTTGTNFTVTTKAIDTVGNPLVTYGGSPTWSDLTGTLSPSGPAPFVNGVSTTNNAVITTAQAADTITVADGPKTGTSNAFDVVPPPDLAPTDIALSNANVNENQPSGTSVGTFTTTDPDAGDTFTYSLVSGTGSADNGSFQIAGDTLQTNAVFDFETKSSYSIRVRSTDSGSLFFEKVFTISINDVNEAPTNISLSANTIDENLPSGTTIGSLSATDQDSGQTHSFSLANTGCGGGPFADNSSFAIVSSSLNSAVSFNFEAKSSYTICVRTTDNGSPNLSFDKQFTITINDVNDAPVATPDTYSGAIGNTKAVLGTTSAGPVVTLTGNKLISNDTDEDATFPHTLSAVAETNTTTGGGSVTINTDGSFVYTPGVGDKNQDDTFTYHVTDGSATTAGTATIHIENFLVWYVDSASAALTHDGRSATPFLNLSSLNGAGGSGDSDGSGDIIFLYQGVGTYLGGIPLETSQQLIGQPAGLTVNGNALVAAAGTTPTITNASGTGVGVANGVDVEGVNISGTSGDGINGSAVTTATVGTTTPVNVSTAGGDGVDLSGAAGGNISIAAPISGSVGHSVTVSGRGGGTVAFSGAITDNGTGISLSSNTGATINFTGGVTASTLTNNAFSATGGGTVNVTGATNTLATTVGTALNVSSTNIGASGLTFKSIASNGASDGIVLSSTGSSGGLTVTGTGSAGTGGTIQSSTNSGVLATSTKDLSLTSMNLSNNGNAVNEGGIRMTDVTGTVSLTSLSVTGSSEDNVYVKNDTSTALALSISGPSCSITNNSSSTGNDGINMLAATTANVTATVDGCSFSGNRTISIGADSADNSTLNVTIKNNTITQGAPNHGNQGIQVSDAGNGNVTFDVENNKVGTPDGSTASALLNTGINIFNGSAGNAFMAGKVLNNVVLNDPTTPSGTSNGFGIRVFNSNLAQIRAKVTGNTVKNVNTDYGILAEASGTSVAPSASHGRLDVEISGNNTDVNAGALDSIRAQARNFNTVCAKIATNTTDGGGIGFFGIFVRQANSAVFDLDGWNGVGTPQAFVATQNPGASTTGSAGTITGVASGTCDFTGVP